jgi:hypothetical protein
MVGKISQYFIEAGKEKHVPFPLHEYASFFFLSMAFCHKASLKIPPPYSLLTLEFEIEIFICQER